MNDHMVTPTVRRNLYASKCGKCGKRVDPGQGVLLGCFMGKWKAGHDSCYPEVSGYDPEKIAAQAKALEDVRLAKVALKKAAEEEMKALKEKLGIDFANPFDNSYIQEAYRDSYSYSLRYTGDGTDEEFKQAVATPAESLYGQLRASGGDYLVSIDRQAKTIRVAGSTRLCD